MSHKGQNIWPKTKRLENHTNNHSATGAGDGNRTRVISLEGWGSTIELLPPKPRSPRTSQNKRDFHALCHCCCQQWLVEGTGFEPV